MNSSAPLLPSRFEREEVINALRQAHLDERLDRDEFEDRIALVQSATYFEDLEQAIKGLPLKLSPPPVQSVSAPPLSQLVISAADTPDQSASIPEATETLSQPSVSSSPIISKPSGQPPELRQTVVILAAFQIIIVVCVLMAVLFTPFEALRDWYQPLVYPWVVATLVYVAIIVAFHKRWARVFNKLLPILAVSTLFGTGLAIDTNVRYFDLRHAAETAYIEAFAQGQERMYAQQGKYSSNEAKVLALVDKPRLPLVDRYWGELDEVQAINNGQAWKARHWRKRTTFIHSHGEPSPLDDPRQWVRAN